jgi:hypothetical protein
VDRVDRWLSAQRGWRRLLIGWLILEPAFINAGLLWSGWGNIDDQGTVPTGSLLGHVAITSLAGVLLVDMQQRLGQRRRRKSRPWEPAFSWRSIGFIYSLMIGTCAETYGDTRTLAWRRHHEPFTVVLFLIIAAGGLMIWNWIYLRKLKRRFESAQQQMS